MTYEDDEFVRIEKESLWRKRQIEENLGQPVYFKPKKEWVGLTNKEYRDIAWMVDQGGGSVVEYGRTIEQVLKEKNYD